MINLNKIFALAETLSEFSVSFVAAEGNVVDIPRASCTSFHAAGNTLNLRCIPSGEIRKVNRYTIIKFNNEEVVI